MANPSKYTQGYDFSGFQDGNPATPLPADRLDTELANISASTEELRDAVMDVRRADGGLKNRIVTRESLSSNLLALTGADTGDWVTATAYVVGDLATSGGRQYQCLVAHTSGTFATDLAAGKWALTAAESSEDAAASAASAAASVANVVHTVDEGNGITVDATDPNNPTVAISEPLYLTGAAADAGDGDTDDTAVIQGIIDDRGVNGVIVIPPGNYYVPGDVTISNIAASPNAGGVRIEATGAVLSGGGKIIVDSCKRLSIIGLDMPSHELHLRGCWHGRFDNLRVMDVIVGEEDGSGFSSSSWNIFVGGYYQRFVVHANMGSYFNHNQVIGANLTGAALQGFTTTRDYAFEFNGNEDCQALTALGCDISGYTAIYNVGAGNTAGDVELLFSYCYFDSDWPTALYGRNNVTVDVKDSHIAGKFLYTNQQSLRGATRGGMFARSSEYTMGWESRAAGNLIPNGDLNLRDLTLGYPISNANGATLTLTSGDGPTRRYIRVVHASGTTLSAATALLPFTTNYCATLLVRKHTGSSDQSVVVGLDGKEFFTINVGSEWVPVQVGPSDDLTGGSSVNLTFGTAAAMDIDVAYIGVHMGQAGGPIMLPQSPSADALTKSGTFTPTGTAVANLDSITPAASRWSRQGDIVTASGSFAADATAAASTTTQGRLTFPIPSALTSFSQVNGTATNAIAGDAGATIIGDSTNDQALVAWQSLTTGSRTFQYMYQYQLL